LKTEGDDSIIVYAISGYLSEAGCSLLYGYSGYYTGEGAGPFQCVSAAFTGNNTMYLVGQMGSRDVNLNTITMGAMYYTVTFDGGIPAIVNCILPTKRL
jgi:hypothetical protein